MKILQNFVAFSEYMNFIFENIVWKLNVEWIQNWLEIQNFML